MNNYILSQFISHHAHPILFSTLFLIIGIIVAFCHLPLIATVNIFLACCILVTVFYFTSYHFNPQWLLFPGSLCLGFFLYQNQIEQHDSFQKNLSNTSLTLNGTVSSVEKIQNPRHRWITIIDLESISTSTTTISCHKSIAIYSVYNPCVAVGDSVQVADVTFKQIKNDAFNLYLAKEKISATAFLDKPKISVKHHPSWNLNRFITQLRNKIHRNVQQNMNKETFVLFSSIFLGNRNTVKQEMDHAKEPFKYWGTSHYLARSGLHLVIFSLIWHYILGFLPLFFFWKQLILVLLIICYSLLSWSSISFTRALIMFFVAKFCIITRHRLHYVHLVALATYLVLILNPLQLFFLDFQLSFGLTFALAWFTHIQQHKKTLSLQSIV